LQVILQQQQNLGLVQIDSYAVFNPIRDDMLRTYHTVPQVFFAIQLNLIVAILIQLKFFLKR